MIRPIGIGLAFLLMTLRVGAAQTLPQPDSATLALSAARAALSYWEAATYQGSREQSVFLRNNSTRTIQIASYEVRECVNISRRVCGVHTPGPVIRPGKTVILVTLVRQQYNEGYSYRYRFSPRFVADSSNDSTPH